MSKIVGFIFGSLKVLGFLMWLIDKMLLPLLIFVTTLIICKLAGP